MRNSKLIRWAVTISLGGFLFGFDTAVISGAERDIQQLWQLNDFTHGLAIAIAIYGTVIGALLGGWPTERFGRRHSLMGVGLLYLVSSLGSAIAWDPVSFMVFRFLGGLGVGVSSIAAPLYISEISPPEQRGRLTGLFQLNIVLGILLSYVSNYLLRGIGEGAWRWMLGVEFLPSLVFLVAMIFVPESPRWLIIRRKDFKAAQQVLETVQPGSGEKLVADIRNTAHEGEKDSLKSLLSGPKLRLLILAFLFPFFNQMTGINAVIYYAPRIFEMTGAGASAALLSTSGIGITNFVFTVIGMLLIDRTGRRSLMWIGTFGLLLSLGLVARAFFTNSYAAVPLLLFIFIGSFAISQGAVIWVFLSEIFPNRIRALGQSFGACAHWICAALLTNVFPYFANKFGGGSVFAFFAVMMFLQLLFVWKLMPETMGVPLEELEQRLSATR